MTVNWNTHYKDMNYKQELSNFCIYILYPHSNAQVWMSQSPRTQVELVVIRPKLFSFYNGQQSRTQLNCDFD